MSAAGIRAAAELILAGAAAFGCAVSWSHVRYQVLVAPVIDGEPETSSVTYHPLLLLLTLLLAAVAGVLAVLGASRIRHRACPARHVSSTVTAEAAGADIS